MNVVVSHQVRARFGYAQGGDTTVILRGEEGLFLAIIDVLGHGPAAHEVALRIEQYLLDHASQDVSQLLRGLHHFLKGSRGAAIGLGFLDVSSGLFRYSGIGNTVARTFGSQEQRLISREGVLGQHFRTPREETVVLAEGDLLLLFTDGIRSHFQLSEYPQLLSDGVEAVVKIILDRFGKDYDDASCIAVRYQA